MKKKILTTMAAHSANDDPEEGSEIYVCTKDNNIIVCMYRSGIFWINQLVALKKDEILWWTTDIVFDENAYPSIGIT